MINHEIRYREIIEETGKVFEKFVLTPMQGRIVTYFTKYEPDDVGQSFSEIPLDFIPKYPPWCLFE